MALILTSTQTNDAKVLYLTDGSSWGSDSVPAYTDVTDAYLTISYKDPDYPTGTTDTIVNIFDVFDNANSASDLIFPIVFNTAPALSVAGTGVNQLPDGVWSIQYTIEYVGGPKSFDSPLEILVNGVIDAEVYKQLSTVLTKYLCSNNYYTKQIDDINLLFALNEGMKANAYVAQQSSIIKHIDTLERLIQ
jgi:hypothetical protein